MEPRYQDSEIDTKTTAGLPPLTNPHFPPFWDWLRQRRCNYDSSNFHCKSTLFSFR